MTQQNLKKTAQNLSIHPTPSPLFSFKQSPPSSGHLVIPPVLAIFRKMDPHPLRRGGGGGRGGCSNYEYVQLILIPISELIFISPYRALIISLKIK